MRGSGPTGATPPPATSGGGVALFGRRWPFVLLGFALLAVGLSSWRPVPVGVWHDDGVYAMVGQSLAKGDGLTYGGVPGSPPAVKFPPLYSLWLGVLWFVLGGLGSVTVVASLMNLAMLAAAGALFAWALHEHARLPVRVALLAGGLGFVSAEVWAPALVLFSEPLFLFLVMSALACWPSEARPRREFAVGGLLALAVLTRSAGVAVAAGMAVALIRPGRLTSALRVLAPPAMAFAAWTWWSSTRAARVPSELRDILGPYGAWLRDQLGSTGTELLPELPAHAAAVALRGGTLVLPGVAGYWVLLGLLLVPPAALGFAAFHRTFRPLPWVAAAYAGMVLLWPFPDARLLAPLVPLVVAAVVVGGRSLLDRPLPRWPRRILAVLAVAWIGSFAAVSAGRVTRGWAAAPYRVRAERLATAVEALSRAAPPGAVVGAPEFWAGLHLHGGWASAPSARFRPWGGEGGSPVWGSPDDQLRLWARVGLDHLLLEQDGVVHGEALVRLERECPGSMVVLAQMPGQMLVRLAWDASCRRRWQDGAG